MKLFFLRFFTWWNGATLNTLFYTRRHGEHVGKDEFGNEYYRTRGGAIDPALGFERRWVIYNGQSEASMTPPGWNGWLHHTVDTPPTKEDYRPANGSCPHHGNRTGTPAAYRPPARPCARGQRAALRRRLSRLDARRLKASQRAPSFRPALSRDRRVLWGATSSVRGGSRIKQ